MNGENPLLSWTVDLFFSESGKRPSHQNTSGILSVHQMPSLLQICSLKFLLCFSLCTFYLYTPKPRPFQVAASRSCWLFMSPEEGSWMEASWWQWNLCIFISSLSHVFRQSITGQHPPGPWLTSKKRSVMSGFFCFVPSSSSLSLNSQSCNASLSIICCLLLSIFCPCFHYL